MEYTKADFLFLLRASPSSFAQTENTWQSHPCILYGGRGDVDSYAYVYNQETRKTRMAHRLAWTARRGNIPVGLFVCHHCDQKCCINVHHLFLGNHFQNNVDAFLKGRRGHPPGFINTLVDLRIEEIVREACASGTCGHIYHRVEHAIYKRR